MAGHPPKTTTLAPGRITWRRIVVGGGGGIVGFALAWTLVHALLGHFQVNPDSPDSWKFAAVFIGVIAVAVVVVVGFAPGWSRRHDARRAAATPPVDPRTEH